MTPSWKYTGVRQKVEFLQFYIIYCNYLLQSGMNEEAGIQIEILYALH